MAVSSDEIVETMNRLLDQRADDATICPSEVARALAPDPHWRELMDDVRSAASQEAQAGRVIVLQGGEPVDLASARGPVRLRRVR